MIMHAIAACDIKPFLHSSIKLIIRTHSYTLHNNNPYYYYYGLGIACHYVQLRPEVLEKRKVCFMNMVNHIGGSYINAEKWNVWTICKRIYLLQGNVNKLLAAEGEIRKIGEWLLFVKIAN